jgi:hypothetical protein
VSLGYYARLEPRSRADDLTSGLAARIYDAAWMLARQWQLGELTGDDGGTPISARHVGTVVWCTGYTDAAGRRSLAPGAGPLEAYAEPGPLPLTARRRADLGRALLRQVRGAGLADRIPALLTAFPLPAGPGAGLAAGRVPDGGAALAAFQDALTAVPPSIPPRPGLTVDDALVDACLAWLADCRVLLGEPAAGSWADRRLGYALTVDAPAPAPGGVRLTADDYAGEGLDWWAFDATALAPDATATATPYDRTMLPTRASFRGMPAARWWQEEDATIDLGGVEANAADLARMALLQFGLVFGNDHFVLPVALPVGAVFRTTYLLVTDTFGVTVAIDPAGHAGPGGRRGEGAGRWTMYTLTLADGSGVADVFLLPATAMHALTSRPIEDVHLLRDEMANLAWAVESIVDGDDGPVRRTERPLPEQPSQPDTGPPRYRLGSTVPPHWYPLVAQRQPSGDVPDLVLERMAYSTEEPIGTLLHVGLTVDDDRIPREGRRLLREHVLTRWTDGTPRGWTRRRATSGRGEGSSGLSFDDAQPTAPSGIEPT